MSLGTPRASRRIRCFPRVSGDEPGGSDGTDCEPQFSPRERG